MGIPSLVLALAVLSNVCPISAQIGLKTAPLTAPRIRHHNDNNDKNNRTGSELFSKWPSIEMGHRRGGSRKMDSELAAIFRGVAYGVTTVIPTTTTAATTTTTEVPVTKIAADDQQDYLQSNNPKNSQKDNNLEQGNIPLNKINFPNWRESEYPQGEIHPEPSQESPVQYPYAESPDVTSRSTPSHDLESANEETGVQVVRADVTKVEWIRALGVVWFVHVYTAAGLYSILAFLALFWLTRVKSYVHLLPTGYYITFHVLMFVAAILRCVHLFHDPYGSEQKLPQPLSQAVEETAWPCLTAAVALVVLAIIRSWQCPRLIPQHNYGPLGLALITIIHLIMTLTALLSAYLVTDQASTLNAASRAVTLAWGSTVGICGLFATWKVGRDSRRYSGQLSLRLGISHFQANTALRNPRAVLIHGTNLALVSCLAQISLAGLHLYALVGPHYILDIPPVYPWYWMGYHSTARMLEILTWVLLCATSALNLGASPNKRSDSSGETKLLTVLGCQCCGSNTSIATQDNVNDIYPGMCQNNRSIRNCGKGGYQETIADPLMGNGKPVIRIEHSIAQNKSSTFQDTGSDAHLLWNNSNNTPNNTRRPLFNESGFVQFKLNADTSQAVNEVLRKSLQNLDLVSQIHDSRYQNKKLSQNQLNASEYSDDPPPYENTTASPLLSHKSNINSHQLHHGGNLEQLLQNQLNTKLYTGQGRSIDDHSDAASITDVSSPEAASPPPANDADWSKCASTCSSISAANSFDVRMYNDFEVSQYYQNPSSASYHMYASLQRPYNHENQAQKNASYKLPNDVALNYHEQNQSTSQLKALLSPKKTVKIQSNTTLLSPTENTQDMGGRLINTRNLSSFKKSVSLSPSPKRSPHFSLRHDTSDSGLAMDYSGYKYEGSADDIHQASNSAQLRSRLCLPNQELQEQQPVLFQNYKIGAESAEFVRPCGHRPRGSQHADTAARQQQSPVLNHRNANNNRRQQPSPIISPSRPPLHPGSPILQERQRLQLQYQLQKRIENEQLKQQSQQRQIEQLIHQRSLEQNALLKTQNECPSQIAVTSSRENVNKSKSVRHQELKPCESPLSIRSASPNDSDSGLPSKCKDSEHKLKYEQHSSVESEYENVLEPFTAEAWPPPAEMIKQAAV